MRILIATVSAGAGHIKAAEAIEEAWRAKYPKDEVKNIDVLNFTPWLYRKAYAEGYVQVVEHAPELYALMFRKTDNPDLISKITKLRRTFSRMAARPFVKEIKKFKPHVVICTHFLPLEIIGGLRKKKSAPKTFVASVVTDFEAHALWAEPTVDLTCVAAEETKARLVARGVSEKNILVTGIPVGANFAKKQDVNKIRKKLGLRGDIPTLLVLSGGLGMGPVAEMLLEMERIKKRIQILVVAGRNDEMREELAKHDWKQITRIFGFVDNMHELMAVSEMVITKPGGLTTSEALALGKPLVVINPLPGQEDANSDFLLEHGAAIKVRSIEEIPSKISKLIGSAKLTSLEKAAKKISKPNAADDVCEKVYARIVKKKRAKIS